MLSFFFEGSNIRAILNYIEVTKPFPSALLAYLGVCTAIIAGQGTLSPRLLLVLAAVFIASAGANGITNYLDRGIDARMERTRNRALPSQRIHPAHKVLPFIIGLILVGLALAYILHPYAFFADLAGTLAASTWRKKVTCVYPQGMIASCAPILMGWFAMTPEPGWELLLLCALIAFWLPLHVWSLNISRREDYIRAGITYFPIGAEVKQSVKALLVFSLLLYASSITLYYVGNFSWLYLAVAKVLGVMMGIASTRLTLSSSSRDAWRLYKLSSIPYLGVIFLVMVVEMWL